MRLSGFASRLAALRRRGRLSARSLSLLAGQSESFVGGHERGGAESARGEAIVALADVLGASIEWLAAGRGEPPSDEQIDAALRVARSRRPRRVA